MLGQYMAQNGASAAEIAQAEVFFVEVSVKIKILCFDLKLNDKDVYMKYSLIFMLPAFFLTGCSVDVSSSMPDYFGRDKAFIRVDNSFQPTPFRLEKMLSDERCMKSEGVYGLTSKVAVMGIKSSYSKRVDGAAPPSQSFLNRGYLEYSIQGGKAYKIWWRHDERSMYGIDLGRTFSNSFMAKDGHTYEIKTKGNDIVIYDVSEGKEAPSVEIKECAYDVTMLGKKEYL